MPQTPSYQLTKHPIGSLREIWALTWPLMLGLLSGSFMFFTDRLILARISAQAMNAAANAGIMAWACFVFPIVIAEMTEVFAGKSNGEGSFSKVGKPIWQMLWLSLFTVPIFWFGARAIAPYLFAGTGNTANELDYFINSTDFGPFWISSIALAGFFVATGRMQVVTYTMIFANVLNIVLTSFLVFSLDMGCKGAALATGISQFTQTVIYLALFLKAEHRAKYGTGDYSFDFQQIKEFLRVAIPSGVGRINEVIAHVVFFRIMIMAGPDTMTCVTMVQSVYMLMGFAIDGLAKASTAAISNLYGAGKKTLLPKILKTAFSLQIILYGAISVILLCFTDQISGLFFSNEEAHLLQNPEFLFTLRKAMFWMTLYFLSDGFCWILSGVFYAASDTKFVMYVSITLNWIAYVLPVYIIIGVYGGSADVAWMILALYNISIFAIYFLRSRTIITFNTEPEVHEIEALS
ncbi:MAG: family efflux transporter [Chlamydiia bacterium]|nr:family efflux transporter [Chlamydiia bacterium]